MNKVTIEIEWEGPSKVVRAMLEKSVAPIVDALFDSEGVTDQAVYVSYGEKVSL